MQRSSPRPSARGGEPNLPDPLRRKVIRETLETMARTERIALALFHYEKMGPTGIAETLHLPRQTVDRLLALGSEQLSAALERTEDRFHETDRRAAA
ncbi:MAG: hypothetical protein GF346_11015 [Candidatus Eisenbacteria bacterium]|nr:hypothetical protein [Candidatus Latescibacterota bacterium]MBD3302968.1 hypothetical protein [Candidatus Eisenbacteria bacterium]